VRNHSSAHEYTTLYGEGMSLLAETLISGRALTGLRRTGTHCNDHFSRYLFSGGCCQKRVEMGPLNNQYSTRSSLNRPKRTLSCATTLTWHDLLFKQSDINSMVCIAGSWEDLYIIVKQTEGIHFFWFL
jgi:hypothetical protein